VRAKNGGNSFKEEEKWRERERPFGLFRVDETGWLWCMCMRQSMDQKNNFVTRKENPPNNKITQQDSTIM
jgi:hypothetical protein